MIPDKPAPASTMPLPQAAESPVVFPRYDFLDGLRAILALAIVLHHCWYTVYDHDPQGVSSFFVFLYPGYNAVSFFIILSGFCLTLPTLKNGFRLEGGIPAFFWRRAWRILPPYYAALGLSLLLILLFIHRETGTHWDMSLPVTRHSVATHLLLLQNFFSNDIYNLNHVFWSIAVEWQIYFFFPLLLLGWRTLGLLTTTGGVILIAAGIELGLTRFFQVAPYVHFLGLFAMGMLVACVSFSPHPVAAKGRTLPWRMIALVTFPVAMLLYNHGVAQDIVFGVFSSSLLVIASLYRDGWLHRLLNFRPLVFIGSFSYSLYLIHAPLIQILWQYPFAPLQPHSNLMCVVLIVVGVPMIVAAAFLFYLCCERPFLRRKDRGRKTVHVR